MKTSSNVPYHQGLLAKKPMNIPNPKGEAFKREAVLMRGMNAKALADLLGDNDLTIKINIWNLPDIERDGISKPMPHNHPWAFRSLIISGSYTEQRYFPNGSFQEERTYGPGDINDMPREYFHMVTKVIPGTITAMVCIDKPGVAWGYIDPETGIYSPAAPDPNFLENLKKINP